MGIVNHDTNPVLYLSRPLHFTALSSRTSGIEFWREGVVYFSLEERRRNWAEGNGATCEFLQEQRGGDYFRVISWKRPPLNTLL